MALCREYAHVGNVFESLAGLGDHAEYADGAGEGGGICKDLVAAVADPVSAGCGEFAVRCDYRDFEEVEFMLDLLGSQHAAARGVHAEYHSLDAFVGADLVYDLCKTVSGHIGGLLAVDDLAA